jgi:hypothetical protein
MRNHKRQLKRALPDWFLVLCVLFMALLPFPGQEQPAPKKKTKRTLPVTFENSSSAH